QIVAWMLSVIGAVSVCLAQYFRSENNPSRDPPHRYRDPADWSHLAVGALCGGSGLFSLLFRWPTAPALAIAITVDCYLAVVLVLVAVRGDSGRDPGSAIAQKAPPHRVFALFSLSLTFLALVTTFGDLYLNSKGICPADDPDCYRAAAPTD